MRSDVDTVADARYTSTASTGLMAAISGWRMIGENTRPFDQDGEENQYGTQDL